MYIFNLWSVPENHSITRIFKVTLEFLLLFIHSFVWGGAIRVVAIKTNAVINIRLSCVLMYGIVSRLGCQGQRVLLSTSEWKQAVTLQSFRDLAGVSAAQDKRKILHCRPSLPQPPTSNLGKIKPLPCCLPALPYSHPEVLAALTISTLLQLKQHSGAPGWLSGGTSAFGSGCDPWVLGACFSLCLRLCLSFCVSHE